MDIISSLSYKGGIFMKKNDKKSMSNSGVINQELIEIKKLQKSADSVLSLWSNTCGGLYTVICC